MFLMGMLIPIHSLLVPIYVVFKNCGISDQWYTLLLPYVSFGLPMGIFLVEGYVKTCLLYTSENEKEQLTKMKASKDDFLGYVDETAAKL